MKSLVREMVGTLSTRLSHFGVTVRELSGDQQLSREEIKDTQILVGFVGYLVRPHRFSSWGCVA